MSKFANFLEALFDTGQLRLAAPAPFENRDLLAATSVLEQFEARYRDHVPHDPPSLNVRAAVHAAMLFYRAAQFSIYREIPAQEVVSEFEEVDRYYEYPELDASDHYSVDLVFRCLPELWHLSNSINHEDPTSLAIKNWALKWPLSSVGIDLKNELSTKLVDTNPEKSVSEVHVTALTEQPLTNKQNVEENSQLFDIEIIVANACLFQMYADRIIEKVDRSRLNDDRVVEKIKASVGLQSELSNRLLSGVETA